MVTFTRDSLVVTGGFHRAHEEFDDLVALVEDTDPDIIAIELKPETYENYISTHYDTPRTRPPIDTHLLIHIAAAKRIPLALIDTNHPGNLSSTHEFINDLWSQSDYDPSTGVPSSLDIFREVNQIYQTDHPDDYEQRVKQRDIAMAGHLQYLANQGTSTFARVGGFHLPRIKDNLETDLDSAYVTEPPIINTEDLPAIEESNTYWVDEWLPPTIRDQRHESPDGSTVKTTFTKLKSWLYTNISRMR